MTGRRRQHRQSQLRLFEDARPEHGRLDARQPRAGDRFGSCRISAAQEHRGLREGVARREDVDDNLKPVRRNAVQFHPAAQNDEKGRCRLALPEQGRVFVVNLRLPESRQTQGVFGRHRLEKGGRA